MPFWRVVDGEKNKPVSGAVVYAWSGECCVGRSSATSAEGRFSFEATEATLLDNVDGLFVLAPSFAPRFVDVSQADCDDSAGGTRAEDQDLVIERGATVGGVVRRDVGTIVADTLVAMHCAGLPPGFRDLKAATAADGRFWFESVPAEQRITLVAVEDPRSEVELVAPVAGGSRSDVVLVQRTVRRTVVGEVMGEMAAGSVAASVYFVDAESFGPPGRLGALSGSFPGPFMTELALDDPSVSIHAVLELDGVAFDEAAIETDGSVSRSLRLPVLVACDCVVVRDGAPIATEGTLAIEGVGGRTHVIDLQAGAARFHARPSEAVTVQVLLADGEQHQWRGAVAPRIEIQLPPAEHCALKVVAVLVGDAVARDMPARVELFVDGMHHSSRRGSVIAPLRTADLVDGTAEIAGVAPGRWLLRCVNASGAPLSRLTSTDVPRRRPEHTLAIETGLARLALIIDDDAQEIPISLRLIARGRSPKPDDLEINVVEGFGASVAVPPGDYDLIFRRGGIAESRSLQLNAGERRRIDLTAMSDGSSVRATHHCARHGDASELHVRSGPPADLRRRVVERSPIGIFEWRSKPGTIEIASRCGAVGVEVKRDAPVTIELGCDSGGSPFRIDGVWEGRGLRPPSLLFRHARHPFADVVATLTGDASFAATFPGRGIYLCAADFGDRATFIALDVQPGSLLRILPPTPEVVVRVQDCEGKPVSSALVTAFLDLTTIVSDGCPTLPRWVPVARAAANAAGTLSVPDVPRGEYRIEVECGAATIVRSLAVTSDRVDVIVEVPRESFRVPDERFTLQREPSPDGAWCVRLCTSGKSGTDVAIVLNEVGSGRMFVVARRREAATASFKWRDASRLELSGCDWIGDGSAAALALDGAHGDVEVVLADSREE